MLHKNRGNRRRQDHEKAVRKQNIAHYVYGDDYEHIVLGKLNKGKVHCSCALCAAKTNAKHLNRSNGPVCPGHTRRLAVSNSRMGKNWTFTDLKKVVDGNDQLREYALV